MKEYYFDKLLNIHTRGEQKGFPDSIHHYPYEPTPYKALEVLYKNYELKSGDQLVDFGCGKGRLTFFIDYYYQATVKGVEMNESFYQKALKNRNRYAKKKSPDDIHFYCCLAEEYQIDASDNCFYFFNPFSVQIFMKTINNILVSMERAAREIELILYYASEDYIHYLENDTAFELKKEIIIPGSYEWNPDERFLIYKLIY
ncbi:methyltransferase [Virgibacillus ainsalahensis]